MVVPALPEGQEVEVGITKGVYKWVQDQDQGLVKVKVKVNQVYVILQDKRLEV